MVIISHLMPKLIKNSVLSLSLFSFISLNTFTIAGEQVMVNPYKQKISLRLSLSRDQHAKGLSGVKSKDMSFNEGMLFVNESMGPRKFWMPDTYFNLDIIFLNSRMQVVGIEKNVPAHPGLNEPPVIYRTGTYEAQYVLETKSGSPFSARLKVGDRLEWKK